jgi:hypothetical protein
MIIRSWKEIVAVGVVICVPVVLAQTHVHGEVEGNWNASGNPYLVEGSIYIPADKTLTINPGVEVFCTGGDSITVYGGLYVMGSVTDSVLFGPQTASSWNGIFFMPGALDNSEIGFAKIWGASVAVTISSCDAGVHNSSLTGDIRGLTLWYAAGTFEDNTISCTYLAPTAVYMLKSDAKLLRNTIIAAGTEIGFLGFGINAVHCTNAIVDYNIIQTQGDGDVYGILYDNCNNIQFKYNVVESVSNYLSNGIYGVDSYQPVHRNNTIVTVSAGVAKGICLESTNAIIDNCIVVGDGNSVGIYCQNSNPAISYNDVWHHGANYQGCQPGVGAISGNPLFVGGTPYSYHLYPESPCIDTGNPSYADPDGSRSDMGAFYYPHVSVPPASETTIPVSHRLDANYPNPFNSETVIPFAISCRTHVTADIYNVMGQKTAHLLDEVVDAGEYRVSWSAGALPSGIYFCRMVVGDKSFQRKMVLLR